MHAQTADSVRGKGLLIAMAVLTAIGLAMVFRPKAPSPFTEHGAFGAGHGSVSVMFGASPRAGAPRAGVTPTLR
jgi:hypothetical protein